MLRNIFAVAGTKVFKAQIAESVKMLLSIRSACPGMAVKVCASGRAFFNQVPISRLQPGSKLFGQQSTVGLFQRMLSVPYAEELEEGSAETH